MKRKSFVPLVLVILGACAYPYNNAASIQNADDRLDEGLVDGLNGELDYGLDDVVDDGSDFGGFNAEDAQRKTIDEKIKEATDEAHGIDPSDPTQKLINVEYDMKFTQEELDELNKNTSSKDKRSAAMIGKRWMTRYIPYQIRSNTFTVGQKSQILASMNIIAKYSCLTFGRAMTGDRILFTNGMGCSSRIGKVGGAQAVELAAGCRTKDIIVHEILHAIGIFHEQSRPDRDYFVTIIGANIQANKKSNFKQETWNMIRALGIPYDYLSIMHYGARTFSRNKQITIKTKDSRYQNIIGTRGRLSFRDVKTLNLMHKCREARKCKMFDGDCPGEGFVGPDCKCWCPGDPYKPCDMTGKTGKTCKDYDVSCYVMAKAGRCTHSSHKDFMTKNCPGSCGLCNKTTNKKAKTCKDENTYCPAWAKNGECLKSASIMLSICKKSCNVKNC